MSDNRIVLSPEEYDRVLAVLDASERDPQVIPELLRIAQRVRDRVERRRLSDRIREKVRDFV